MIVNPDKSGSYVQKNIKEAGRVQLMTWQLDKRIYICAFRTNISLEKWTLFQAVVWH